MTNGTAPPTSLPAQAGALGIEALQPAPAPAPAVAAPTTKTYQPGGVMYEKGFRTPHEYWIAQRYGAQYGPHGGKHVPEGAKIVNTVEGIDVMYDPKIRGVAGVPYQKKPEQVTEPQRVVEAATARPKVTLVPKAKIIPKLDSTKGSEEYRYGAGYTGVGIPGWKNLTTEAIAKRYGYEYTQRTLAEIALRHNRAIRTLKKFEGPPSAKREYPKGGAPFEYYEKASKSYDLVGAIKAGHLKEVKLLFPPKAVKAAQDIIKAEEKAATLEVMRQKGDRWIYMTAKGNRIITDAERTQLIKEKGGRVRDMTVKYQPALILPADKEWQILKDKPKDDPKRRVYLEKWYRKVADTLAFASLAATPWTVGGVGTLGMRAVPPVIARVPVLGKVPQLAAQVVVSLGKLTVAGAPPAYMAARVIDENNAKDLQANWQKFQALSSKEKDKYAKQAGYPGYKRLTDAQKAVVLLHYAAPSEKALDKWLHGINANVGKLNEAANKGAGWLRKQGVSEVVVQPVKVAEGVMLGVVEGVHYVSALPVIAANIGDKAPTGNAKAFASMVATGMAGFFAAIPMVWKSDPAYQTGRLTGLFILSPKALIKLAQGLGYNLNPAHIKGFGRAIAIEFNSLRVPKLGEASKADMLKLGKSIVKQLQDGKAKATAKLGSFKVNVRNVPYQMVKPGRYYHFTTDITKFPEGKAIEVGVKKLHLAPQAAPRFAVMSASGQPMKHPGLIELVVSKKYNPELYKTLSKGEVELETAIQNRTLEYVGKSKGHDVRLGTYPIHRYMLVGDYVTPRAMRLTPKEFAKVQALTAREIAIDMIRGTPGRKEALKKLFARDPRIKEIDKQIEEIKREQPEIIGPKGEVLRQRKAYSHPEVGGMVRPRVTAVVKHPDTGAVLLVMDKTETAYGLPGGQIDVKWKPGKLGFTPAGHGKRYLTLAGAAHGQVKSETGIGLKSTTPKGIYLGKVNRHAMSGSYVFEARPDTLEISRTKYQKGKTPELKDAIWWDGKTDIEVYPATYDILKGMGYNMRNVKISKAVPELLKFRDTAYGRRLKTGKTVNVKDIKEAEIKALRKAQAKIIRGREPGLADYLTAEPDFSTIRDLVMGRRRAVKVTKGEIAPEAIRVLAKHPELKTRRATRLIEKQRRGEKLTEAELKQYREAIDRAFEKQRRKLQDAFDRAEKYVRRRYPHEYNKAYTFYMKAITAAMARYRPAMGDKESYLRTVLAERRTPVSTRMEPYEPPMTPSRAIPQPRIQEEPLRIPTRKAATYTRISGERYPTPKRVTPKGEPTPYKTPTGPYKPPKTPTDTYKYKLTEPEPTPGKPPPPLILPKNGAKYDEFSKKAKGLITFRMGELKGGRDVWHVYRFPYTIKNDKFFWFGPAPPPRARVVEGPESAYRTVQQLYGTGVGKVIYDDIGFQKVAISGSGKNLEIKFTPDIDKRIREKIKKAPGAVAWRQGKVGNKDRWDVITYPYSGNNYYMVLGEEPEGATVVEKGPGSAYGTAQVIRGKAPAKEIRVDSGAQDIIIKPQGKKVKLKFIPDPEGKTTGDITIGQRMPSISERKRTISSGRSFRLTPKFRGLPR